MQKDVVREIWPYFLEKMGFVLLNMTLFFYFFIFFSFFLGFFFCQLSIRKEKVYEWTSKEEKSQVFPVLRQSPISIWCFLCAKWRIQATGLKNITAVACKILIILILFKYLIRKQTHLMFLQSCRCFAFKQLYYSLIASQDSF